MRRTTAEEKPILWLFEIKVILPTNKGPIKEVSFPDTENMYGFLDLLLEDGFDVSRIILPESSLV